MEPKDHGRESHMDPETGGPESGVGELVRRSRSGDREAFGRLYERSARRVAARIAAAGVRGGPEAVADLVHEAFIKAWRNLAGLREEGSFGAWVETIGANLARDHLARDARRGAAETARHAGSAPPDPARVVELADAVGSLPEEMRAVLELRFRQGLGYAKIASRLDITEENVAVRLHRARRRLRELLGES